MRTAQLPAWANAIAPGKIEIQADGFYPEWLELLGITEQDIDQYALECAFQCAKMDIQFAIAGTELMPPPGGALVIIANDGSKSSGKWAQKNYPEGKGVKAASKGGEARAYFKRIRQIPSI
ncbi:hypothetical protein SAMN05216302_101439 [Nitrosomonas aestuarii]|uniref:Uncharacterized protein n=1 Tax=Nitrosomonas aestuarii TaxID=52441 RepID=A0A1I4C0H3_9PROT|nr:hypothetical protein [Nitrosomonas aestuarii]SFK74562.1 hypothetical protein SAMN05216302_101439 [Nitrosomonas aestuarii]